MTNAYFDASALVALFVGESFGERTEAYIVREAPAILVSDFAAVEFASAISRLVRMSQLPRETASEAFADFDAWRRRSTTTIAIVAEDLATAEGLLRGLDFNLRTGDAIHISVARRAQASLATFDRRIADVASAIGVPIAPL